MGIKVLFIYPNTYGMNMLPPAIAMFSAILKKYGHDVQIFDILQSKENLIDLLLLGSVSIMNFEFE